ncbi:LLM class flavin-dependent oxidoreductase [Lysinibacillus sp. CNPSo 3705]|uniref:LLM class flavin-dependent oxidoreductase n=1 Tax=Lysinibacillus sp. CNPSo 3705 TaxID=3028148 RepID=UPI0023641F84|nr:LLM class flavin-dependent oxidoreductase [Lysinibacillus sp. CNPSo 3705]MDD1502054.1 LLM class flavin-dependent oxidoreductase [Lysinibacillus sp. CNPSo 3705]
MSYSLGILDQSPIIEDATNEQTLQKTVALAQKAEQLGYSRFWVSEHHNTDTLAGSSPEVLVSYLLAKTKSINIGSGGVMLQHYSPYKVAENFHVLASLEPGRVDLGIGKAPGGLPLSTKALQYGTLNNDENDFEERLTFLQQLIEQTVLAEHELYGVQATPIPKVKPALFLLGASPQSATLAGTLGIAFVFARFINSDNDVLAQAATAYRTHHPNGHFAVSIAALAAPTKEEAIALIGDQKITKVHLASGKSLTLQSVELAEKFGQESGESFTVKQYDADILCGTPDDIKMILDDYHVRYRIDEFILHTPVLKEFERERSFELLSPVYLQQKEAVS